MTARTSHILLLTGAAWIAAATSGLSAQEARRPDADASEVDPIALDVDWGDGSRRSPARSGELPGGLRGTSARFPIGAPRDGLEGLVYVPRHYDGSRPWPVLVEGTVRGDLDRALGDFRSHADRHGFILLAVEWLYVRGETVREDEVWSREGDVTVRTHTRLLRDILGDMVTDERNVLRALKQLRDRYNVLPGGVAVSGFLGAGTMAYRLPLGYPHLFCAGIARSATFSPDYLPGLSRQARKVPIHIVFGAMEKDVTLKGSRRAARWFESRDFDNVQSEEIPNSGVDSRPEIAANTFQVSLAEVIGEDWAALSRAANIGEKVLLGLPAKDPSSPDRRPISPEEAADRLADVVKRYGDSDYTGYARLLAARLLIERLGDTERAEPLLRWFDDPPGSRHPSAAEGLLLLVERVIDPDDHRLEAVRLLKRARSRTQATDEQTRRANRLLARLQP